jgi:hypothetical protein
MMPKIAWTRGGGPLAVFAGGFEEKLVGLGYRPGGVATQLGLMRQLDRWLAGAGLAAGDLTEARVEQFLAACRNRGQRRVPTLAGARALLAYLIELGVIDGSSPPVVSARDQLLADYRRYLLGERGLTPETTLRYLRFAKRFLAQRVSRTGQTLGCEGLTSVELNEYLLATSAQLAVESAQREAADGINR